MARFNARSHQAKPAVATVTSPLSTTTRKPNTRTFEGGAGYTRDAKTELFLRATGAFHGGEGSFYESANQRDEKLRELVRKIALEDPDWGFEFARWLRAEGNIRTGALMFAVEFVHERLAAQQHGVVGFRVPQPDIDGGPMWEPGSNRRIIDVVCQRPDEPGEILAIWTAWYGRRIPKAVKRGVADAAARLYSERSLLKYDTDTHAYRFADVLELTHVAPDPSKAAWQGDLFKYALDRRHNRANGIPDSLGLIRRNALLRSEGELKDWLDADVLKQAGMTWEDALSAVGSKVDKGKLWEALIPSMGIMALLRNLRNFDQAGVSDKTAQLVINRLTNPAEIARSRQFPFRFLAAYRATSNSLRWSYPLEQALGHSLLNVPVLDGRTLILVDRSPSMFPQYDYAFGKSKIQGVSRADQAAIFGSALALRAEKPTLVEFHQDSKVITFDRGMSVLKLVEKFGMDYGTNIPDAVKRHYDGHDRVIILTDEQTRPGWLPANTGSYVRGGGAEVNDLVPKNIPVFMWNFAGYSAAAMPSGGEARFHLGGLTDKAFRLISILESGIDGSWPWENADPR